MRDRDFGPVLIVYLLAKTKMIFSLMLKLICLLGIHKDIVFKRREGETVTCSILSCVTLDVVLSDTGHCNQSDREQDMAALPLCNQLSGHGS